MIWFRFRSVYFVLLSLKDSKEIYAFAASFVIDYILSLLLLTRKVKLELGLCYLFRGKKHGSVLY